MMKILMLVNWKVEQCSTTPENKQPPDYYVKGENYWFYRYFQGKTQVDVVDIHSFPWLERFEKNILRFYVLQAIRAIPKLDQYDLIVSHGMQSGVVISLWRRLFKAKAKHIVFDIGSFASASEQGFALKLMQFASKSIDYLIYHTSSQIQYYKKCFPWILDKCSFVPFGTDLQLFNPADQKTTQDAGKYILCVGYSKRDWETLVQAYKMLDTDVALRFVGHEEQQYRTVPGVQQIPFIPVSELMRQIYNARFCVLPLESYNYSYGQMTLMQQMALGKCVIAARVPSLVDYVKDGENAILYEPKNVQNLAQTMQALLADNSKVEKCGQAARKWLRENCNEEIMARQLETIFRACC